MHERIRDNLHMFIYWPLNVTYGSIPKLAHGYPRNLFANNVLPIDGGAGVFWHSSI